MSSCQIAETDLKTSNGRAFYVNCSKKIYKLISENFVSFILLRSSSTAVQSIGQNLNYFFLISVNKMH